jgi:hypothetical protein
LVAYLQRLNKRLLRYIGLAEPPLPLLSLFLAVEEFVLTRSVAAVRVGGDAFAQGRGGIAGDVRPSIVDRIGIPEFLGSANV